MASTWTSPCSTPWWLLATWFPNYWSLGTDPRVPTSIINDGFPIESGELVIQIGREHQFERLCRLIDRPRMAGRRSVFQPRGLAGTPG